MQVLQHWEVLLVEKLLACWEVVMMVVHCNVRAWFLQLSLLHSCSFHFWWPETLLGQRIRVNLGQLALFWQWQLSFLLFRQDLACSAVSAGKGFRSLDNLMKGWHYAQHWLET